MHGRSCRKGRKISRCQKYKRGTKGREGVCLCGLLPREDGVSEELSV